MAPYGRMNTAPTATAVVGTNDLFTGVVTGTVSGTDPDGDALSYSAPATINVTVYGDTSYEADELIRVELTGGSGGVLNSDPSHYRQTVTITNDDPASPVV